MRYISPPPKKKNKLKKKIITTILSPPLQVISLQSGCTGYTEYAKLSPYFYKVN